MDAPVIHDSIAMFSLVFRRSVQQLPSSSSSSEIVSFVATNGPCNVAEISNSLDIPRSTVNYRLKKLVSEGALVQIGVERSGVQRYRLP